jgi:autotransporter translocation and assembly factor TamB
MRVDNAVLGSLRLSEASAKAKYGADGVARIDAIVAPAAAAGRVELDCVASLPAGGNFQGSLAVKDAGMLVLSELAGDSVEWLDGRASLRIDASGSFSAPRLAAEAQFSRAAVAVAHLKEPLRGLAGKVRLADDAVTVANLQASCGRSGALRASGRLPLLHTGDSEVRFSSMFDGPFLPRVHS